MQNWSDPRTTAAPTAAPSVGVPRAARDAGLRSYMLSVYNYMASGVLLTGIVALLFANSGMAAQVLSTPLRWVIMFAPLAFVMVMSFGMNRLSTGALQGLFWAFAVTMGLSMSSIFLVFTGASIAQTFFAVAAAFLGLSLWGYTTKKDLSGMGTFLIMGVIGLFVAIEPDLYGRGLQWMIPTRNRAEFALTVQRMDGLRCCERCRFLALGVITTRALRLSGTGPLLEGLCS